MIIFRNLGDHIFYVNQNEIWLTIVENIKFLSKIFLTMAMAAIGLSTNFRDIKKMGYKPFLVGFITIGIMFSLLFFWLSYQQHQLVSFFVLS